MTIGSIIIGTSSEGKEQLNTGTFIFFAIYLIYTLLIITPTLAVSVRRLHDIGQSGWMYLIALIPFVGGIWFFVLLCTNSKNGTNKWGENPKGLGNDTGINQIGTE
jgi:uncharacterized membrane protein YhaH (DUF805 family)